MVLTMLPLSSSSQVLWNTGILPQHYTASKPRRPRYESSPPWKPQILQFVLCTSKLTNKFRKDINIMNAVGKL